MWPVSEWICLCIMLFVSVGDVKDRKISVYILLMSAAASILYHCVKQDMNIWNIAGGALIGGGFLFVSRITEEGIGYGDSLSILVLGIYLGFWKILMVLSLTFFLILYVSVPLLCIKKMSRTYTLPFLPFLTGGYLFLLLTGGISG